MSRLSLSTVTPTSDTGCSTETHVHSTPKGKARYSPSNSVGWGFVSQESSFSDFVDYFSWMTVVLLRVIPALWEGVKCNFWTTNNNIFKNIQKLCHEDFETD